MQIYSDKKQIYKRKRAFRIKLYFLFLLVFLLLISVFHLAVYSPLFKIKSISVENNKFLTEKDVLKILKPIILGENFAGTALSGIAGFNNLLFWPGGKVIVSNPAVADIDIEKNWIKKTVKIKVNERQMFAIWCVADGKFCYWMDKQGIIFGEAPLTEGLLVPVVFDLRENNIFFGTSVEENRFVDNLISILENLNKTGFSAEKVIFDGSLKELRVNTAEGPALFFSVRFDSYKNIRLIENLNYKNAEYIDLRVENKIFYKTKK